MSNDLSNTSTHTDNADTDEHGTFKEVFNWWYLVGIVAAFVAFPLMHILAWVGRIIFM